MDSRTEPARVPVVVFDDGSLTRRGLERVARFASSVELIGGTRAETLASVFDSLGVPVRAGSPGIPPEAGLRQAAAAAAAGAAVLVTGTPLDAGAWLKSVRTAAEEPGFGGLIVHVPAPGQTDTVTLCAAGPGADTWTVPVSAAFGQASGLRPPMGRSPAVPFELAGELLEADGTDSLFVFAGSPYPRQEPKETAGAEPRYRVSAAATILAVLTDTGLDLTNRAPVTTALRVRFGSPGSGETDIGAAEAELAPRESTHVPYEALGFLAGLEPPAAVVRHWSHETETVYDGGGIRINGLDVRYLDEDGGTIAVRSYGTRQGLHVGVVAPELVEALGSSLRTAAGEYARMGHGRTTPLGGILGMLASAAGPEGGRQFPSITG